MPTTINPVVHYPDPEKGARWLVDAFGFVLHQSHASPDGEVQYVETSLDGVPLVYISNDDVDAMHDRAVGAGVEILMPPTDQDYGSRDFVARDPDGNLWCFGTFTPSVPG